MKTHLQPICSILFAFVEIMTYGGVIIGWCSLEPILAKEGYFSSGCERKINNNSGNFNETQICESQVEQLNLVFTITTSVSPIVSLLCGLLFDKKGGWVAKTTMLALIASGNMLNILSDPHTSSWLLFISFPLMSIGGYGLGYVNISLASLFPKIKALVSSLMSSSFDCSIVVFLLMSFAYDYNGDLKLNMAIYSCGLCLMFLMTFVLTPRYSVPDKNRLSEYEYGYKEISCCSSETRYKDSYLTKVPTKKDRNVAEVKLAEQLKKPITWANIAHFSTIQFCLTFFVGSFDFWVTTHFHNDSSNHAKYYQRLFGVLQFLGGGLQVFGGFCNDYYRNWAKKRMSFEQATFRGVSTFMLLGDFFVVTMLACTLIPGEPALVTSIICQVVGRAFSYSSSVAFVSVYFPSHLTGSMFSSLFCVGGLVLLLQFPATLMVTRVFDNQFHQVYLVLLVVSTLAMAHPVALFMKSRAEKNNNRVKKEFLV